MKPSAVKKKYIIYRAIKKYGSENFYYEILEDNIPLDELDKREIYYIEQFKSFRKGYNSTKGGDGRLLNKIEDINYIIKELKSGRLIMDIAKELKISTETIARALRTQGIDSPSSIQGKRKMESLRTIDRNAVKVLYLEGYTYKEISNKLHINPRSVSRIVKELDINKRPNYDYLNIDTQGILTDIENGAKRKDILNKYNLSGYALRKIISNQKGNSNDYPEME